MVPPSHLTTEYDYVIIDPSSPEFNRGSFCYLPFILYSALKEAGWNVYLAENFTVLDLDNLPVSKNYLISIWSYPQIDIAKVLYLNLPNSEFFGYGPFIDQLKYPKYIISDNRIATGLLAYPKYFDDFKSILLSDCDMHLKKYEGQVYPFFTSYGCPNACEFCPSTINQPKRISLPVDKVCETLYEEFWKKGRSNIHFTDEDFFYDINRAYEILHFVRRYNFNFIALGSVEKIIRYIEKYDNRTLHEGGMRLIEVGFETADPTLRKLMAKKESFATDRYAYLAKICEIDIFWLTLSFFPGETVRTLRQTGKFLEEHGFSPEELYGRIRTNGTPGGLGQFFQPYPGTLNFEQLTKSGRIIDERPIRLVPSYVPNSFLDSYAIKVRNFKPEELFYLRLYRCEEFKLPSNFPQSIRDICFNFPHIPFQQRIIYLAICARLGVIR